MNTESNSCQSRFGYHPCDYATFCKLRLLHNWYFQTLCDFHHWWRWWRKQPQNRQGAEPQYCPMFVRDRPWLKRRRMGGQDGVRLYPKTIDDHGVVGWFQQARVPQVDAVPRFDGRNLRRIDELYQEAAAWFAEEGEM